MSKLNMSHKMLKESSEFYDTGTIVIGEGAEKLKQGTLEIKNKTL
jgi:hypothetical protein